MGRLLVIVLIVVLVVWLLRRALAGPPRPAEPPQAPGTAQADLVRCAHCGVNLPRTEAILAVDRVYCSEEHARLGPRSG